jgi:hypothetical protein
MPIGLRLCKALPTPPQETITRSTKAGVRTWNLLLRLVKTDNCEASNTLPYALDKAAILVDLTSEQPQWILSAYGPGRFAPAQLFGGEREQSFEEMRLLHYIGMASGNPQQAVC